MLDCTTDTYETLYARWLEKPGELLDWGGYNPEKHRLLDLCGGTGAVSKEALRRGAQKVWLADLNPRVDSPLIDTVTCRAEDLATYFNACPDDALYGKWKGLPSWNFVVCRQAIGYLDLLEASHALYDVTPPGALFVCNAFVKPKWSFRPYRYQGRWFVEASGYLGRRVFHLQATDGDFDVTAFRWHTPEEIERAFFKPCWTLAKREITSRSARFCFQRGT